MLLFNSINPLNYAIAWTVMHSIWQILLITTIAGILQATLQASKAKLRYNILVAAIAFTVLITSFTFLYYYSNSSREVEYAINANPVTSIENSTINTEAVVSVKESNKILSFAGLNDFVENNLYTIVILWLVGMVMALLRLLGNISYIYYLKNKLNFPVDEYWENALSSIANKLDVKKKIAILESALVRAPIVIGHLKPMILFPIGAINRLSMEEVESIIAHELAHVKRNDYIINILMNVAESIFYFHPAMWWLSAQIKVEREHCCDDIAIEALGSPINYAKSLVAVQEMSYYSPQLAMAFATKENKSQLAVRVNRLISKPSRAININEKGIASIMVLGMIVLFVIAARPYDKGEHCVIPPAIEFNKGNDHYLKFQNYTLIDSMYLNFLVEDGEYNYSDNIHEVNLKIKDRHVISFNLNGLEVPGKDIVKFQKLIETILTHKEPNLNADDQFTSVYFGSDDENSVDIEEDKKVAKAMTKTLMENGFETKNTKYAIHFNAKNLVINGKIQSKILHDQMILLYETFSSREVFGDTGLSFIYTIGKDGKLSTHNIMPSPPSPPMPPNCVSNPNAPGAVSAPFAPSPPAPNSKPASPSIPSPPSPPSSFSDSSYTYSYIHSDNENSSMRYGDHNGYTGTVDEAFDLWLDATLLEDGYIKDNKQFSYAWDSKGMKVDGKSVDKKDIEKYAAKRDKMTGQKMTKTFMKTRTITRD